MWLENPAVAHATEHGEWQKPLQGTSVSPSHKCHFSIMHPQQMCLGCRKFDIITINLSNLTGVTEVQKSLPPPLLGGVHHHLLNFQATFQIWQATDRMWLTSNSAYIIHTAHICIMSV
jgi:hypothetical protein